MLYLVSEDAPSRTILCAGAGGFARTMIYETAGIHLDEAERTPENIAARFADISSAEGQQMLTGAFQQTGKFVANAAKAKGIKLTPR